MSNKNNINRTKQIRKVLISVIVLLVLLLTAMIVYIMARPDVQIPGETQAPNQLTEEITAPADSQIPSESLENVTDPQKEMETVPATEPMATEGKAEKPTTETVPKETEGREEKPTSATVPKETEDKEEKPTTAPTPKPTVPKQEPTEAPTEPPRVSVVKIVTPYCTLNFPEKWDGFLQADISEAEPYKVTYYADLDSGKNQKLFSISFGGNADNAVGILKVNGKEVPVCIESVEFKPDSSWSDNEVNIVFSMQEALNDILADMSLVAPQKQPQASEPILPEDNGEDMAIDTPYGVLHYPSRWKNYLSLKVNDKGDYSVAFYSKISGHPEQCIFKVYFDSNQGIQIGTIQDESGNKFKVSIEIVSFDPDDSWSASDKSIVVAMQEDMNYLLVKLS